MLAFNREQFYSVCDSKVRKSSTACLVNNVRSNVMDCSSRSLQDDWNDRENPL